MVANLSHARNGLQNSVGELCAVIVISSDFPMTADAYNVTEAGGSLITCELSFSNGFLPS